MATKLPKLSVEIRQLPDWPGYAIDRSGTVWQLVRDKWSKMQPRRTAAGSQSIWLHLPNGGGNATRRVSDLYREVFNDALPQTSRRVSNTRRTSGR